MLTTEEQIVRSATDRRAIGDWELVLASVSVPYRVRRDGQRWLLIVDQRDASAAATAISAFESENAPSAGAGPVFEYGPTRAAVVAAVLLVGFHVLSLYAGPEWVRRGRASTLWILDGQLWRSVTALTLHAGAAHLAGNVVVGGLLGGFVCRAFGPGLGLFLMLLSGAAGNLANAFFRSSPHHAIGASTAVFGGVGVLVALQFVRRVRAARPPAARPPARAWLPIAAGLALLGMLGGAEESDVLAHLFGFLMGLLFGALARVALSRPPGPWGQGAWAALTAVAVIASWGLAWR